MNIEYTIRLKKIEEVIAETIPEKISPGYLKRTAGPSGYNINKGFYNNINKPALELINRGGKRWRPMLTQICCELEGGGDAALPLVPLVEFPHNGSLIIDDMEDKADWRRGAPAVHLIYGEDMAINSGNMLYFLPAFLIDESPFEAEIKLLLYKYYTENLRRLHYGQGFDIQWHKDPDYIPKEEEYLQMCRFKTGSLARLAAQIGIIIGGKNAGRAELMGSVCEDMGVGFQILDDVINLTTGNPGKKRGDDIIEGKKSLPVIYYFKDAAAETEKIKKLFKQISGSKYKEVEQEIEEVIELFSNSGAIETAHTKAVDILKTAKAKFVNLYPPSEPRILLEEMINSFLQ